MSIYSKERTKITISTILVSLGIILCLWLLLFVTDYIMYKNDMPLLFAKTEIREIQEKRVTVESGLGYYVIMDENNLSEMFLFGYKIK